MANEKLARRYAVAVFQLASDRGVVDSVGRDLHVMSEAIYEDASTKEFFLSPVIDRKEKEQVLTAAFAGKANEVALHTVLLLVRKHRESLLKELVAQYDVLQMRGRGAEPLTVTSAKELSREKLGELVSELERIYSKTFDVTQRVDPGLIGGVRIMMGELRIDGSVEGRLEELSRTLFAKN